VGALSKPLLQVCIEGVFMPFRRHGMTQIGAEGGMISALSDSDDDTF
jgi:hypothetical protein